MSRRVAVGTVGLGLALLALTAAPGFAMSDAPQGCAADGMACAPDERCAWSARCGEDGAPGVCRPRPQACTMEYAPVCGCDGATHSNACAAHAAGTDIARQGPCDVGPADR